jgi:hypothetical protein
MRAENGGKGLDHMRHHRIYRRRGHAARKRKDPTAWRHTPEAHQRYLAARAEAQQKANELGMDVGLEANDLFKTFSTSLLPSKPHRAGYELRVEVVSPERLDRIQPGYISNVGVRQ